MPKEIQTNLGPVKIFSESYSTKKARLSLKLGKSPLTRLIANRGLSSNEPNLWQWSVHLEGSHRESILAPTSRAAIQNFLMGQQP